MRAGQASGAGVFAAVAVHVAVCAGATCVLWRRERTRRMMVRETGHKLLQLSLNFDIRVRALWLSEKGRRRHARDAAIGLPRPARSHRVAISDRRAALLCDCSCSCTGSILQYRSVLQYRSTLQYRSPAATAAAHKRSPSTSTAHPFRCTAWCLCSVTIFTQHTTIETAHQNTAETLPHATTVANACI